MPGQAASGSDKLHHSKGRRESTVGANHKEHNNKRTALRVTGWHHRRVSTTADSSVGCHAGVCTCAQGMKGARPATARCTGMKGRETTRQPHKRQRKQASPPGNRTCQPIAQMQRNGNGSNPPTGCYCCCSQTRTEKVALPVAGESIKKKVHRDHRVTQRRL